MPPAERPGQPERIEYEYRRHGTLCLIGNWDVVLGQVIAPTIRQTRTEEDFVWHIHHTIQTDAEAGWVFVMDNLNTHRPGSLYESFPPATAKALWERFEFIHTPAHGSWLNIAEIELSVLVRQCLDRRIDTLVEVQTETRAWQNRRDNSGSQIDWQFTDDDARIKLKRLYPTLGG